MLKKGQVTLFIIIAIIIVAAGALFFVFKDNLVGQKGSVSPELIPIKNYVEDCLEKTALDGLRSLGMRGGYFDLYGESYINYFSENIPLYYFENKSNVPSIDVIESELSSYVENYLGNCLNNFEVFEQEGYLFKEENLSVESRIKDGEIFIFLSYPLTIKKGEFIGKIEEFEILVKSNVKKLIEVSEEIVYSYSKMPGFVCLTCMEDILKEKDVEIISSSFFSQNKNFILFSVSFAETDLNWRFALEA